MLLSEFPFYSPLNYQDDYDEISKKVKIYMGMTNNGGMGLKPSNVLRSTNMPKYVQKYSGRKIFVNPLLSTSKVSLYYKMGKHKSL